MNFAKKFLVFCVAIYAALSSVEANNVQEGEACLVQYLQNKEKLSSEFRSAVPPTSRCRLIIPLTLRVLKSSIESEIKTKVPNAADCLTEEFDNKWAIDHLIKIDVVDKSGLLTETERETQLQETRNEFKNDLKKIASQCVADDTPFIEIFNEQLGIKNESLTMAQYDYCLAMYVSDKNVLDLGMVDINPHRIDTDSVDCNEIIDVDKSKSEKDLIEKTTATVTSQSAVMCIRDSYRSDTVYDYSAALKVVNKLNFTRHTKEVEVNRISQKVGEFTMSVFACLM